MNRLPSARTVVRLITPFLIAACQPQARRLLLLDLALSDPVVLNGTARPWADAGYKVQYRRFYPHLTRADLPQFRTLVFLLGREPEAASDALTAGDVALLDEWVRRGGVVVLGYDGDGEGYLDRWTANRWLAYEGAGISIGDRVLEDTTLRVVTTGRMQPWVVAQPVGDEPLGSAYDPFPLDRNHAVVTREPTQLLALTSHSAFVRASRSLAPRSDAGVAAAARIGEGLVVVMSRHALGTLGPQYRPSTTPFLATGPLADTYAFLRAVARWTRRPAEWAHVPPATHRASLALQDAPLPVELQAGIDEALAADPDRVRDRHHHREQRHERDHREVRQRARAQQEPVAHEALDQHDRELEQPDRGQARAPLGLDLPELVGQEIADPRGPLEQAHGASRLSAVSPPRLPNDSHGAARRSVTGPIPRTRPRSESER